MSYIEDLSEAKNLFRRDKLPEALSHIKTLQDCPEYSTDVDFFFQVAELKHQIFRLNDDLNLLFTLAEEVKLAGHRFNTPLLMIDTLVDITESIRRRGGDHMELAKYLKKYVTTVFQSTNDFIRRKAKVLNIPGQTDGLSSNDVFDFRHNRKEFWHPQL